MLSNKVTLSEFKYLTVVKIISDHQLCLKFHSNSLVFCDLGFV